LAELISAQLLGETIFGVSWLFFIVEDLQLGFGLIILGKVSRKSANLFMLMNACCKFYLVHVKDYEIACLKP
jgi:hypothetical protein